MRELVKEGLAKPSCYTDYMRFQYGGSPIVFKWCGFGAEIMSYHFDGEKLVGRYYVSLNVIHGQQNNISLTSLFL